MMNEASSQVEELPRVYTLQRLPPAADLLAEAAALAAAGAFDATLVLGEGGPSHIGQDAETWPVSSGDLSFAVVIRGELERREIGQIGLLLATALAQSIGTVVTPLTLLQLRWPHTLLLNEGLVGRTWLQSDQPGAGSRDWLLAAATLNLPARPQEQTMEYASLIADGGAECEQWSMLVDVSRRFLRLLNQWQDRGLAEPINVWSRRLIAPGALAGGDCELLRNGDLRVGSAAGSQDLDLAAHALARS